MANHIKPLSNASYQRRVKEMSRNIKIHQSHTKHSPIKTLFDILIQLWYCLICFDTNIKRIKHIKLDMFWYAYQTCIKVQTSLYQRRIKDLLASHIHSHILPHSIWLGGILKNNHPHPLASCQRLYQTFDTFFDILCLPYQRLTFDALWCIFDTVRHAFDMRAPKGTWTH